MNTRHFLILLGILTYVSWPSSVGAEEIRWRVDYHAAHKEAESKGLPIILDCGTENCYWCKKLDETTFSDPTISKMMNEKFIPLRIDAERDTVLAKALEIARYPTVVLATPDGRIIGQPLEGYQDPLSFYENLQRALATTTNPEWMVRDYQLALKAVNKNDLFRAVALLKTVVEEGRGRPIHTQAEQLLRDVEAKAQVRINRAKEMHAKGEVDDALDTLSDVAREFAGTQSAREASNLYNALNKSPDSRQQQRQRRAKELLTQAREDFRQKQFLACLDRCEMLAASFGDLQEGMDGIALANEIKANTEWVQSACDALTDRLSGLYLAMADNWIRKGQPQQAVTCLERIIRTFPGSRQAEQAQMRLNQIQGQTTRRVGFQN